MPDIKTHSCKTSKRHKLQKYDDMGIRETSSKRTKIYGHKWRGLRDWFLRRNPFCVDCKPDLVPATEVDHIKPHNGDMKLFWDKANLQGLCKRHHSAKTMRELNERKKAAYTIG